MTSAPVRQIAQDADGVTVRGDGGAVRARRVIVAVPPALAGRIDYTPALPPARDALTQRMPMGSTTKLFAFYDAPFWRSDGRSGESVSSRGPLSFTFDNSAPDGPPYCLLGFAVGAAARALSTQPQAERRRAVVAHLVRLFGPRAGDPIDFVEQDWSAEPWTRGCPVGALGPGGWTQFGDALRRPVGRLHWAGTETARVWTGYLEGALEAGDRAAREALAAL